MSQGLQVWDASGRLTFDSSTYAAKLIAAISVSGAVASSYSDSRIAAAHAFFIWLPNSRGYYVPAVSFGSGIVYYDNTAGGTSGTLIIGQR